MYPHISRGGWGGVSPDLVFFYIYSILYSLNYRVKYGQELMEDFPRLPLTSKQNLFFRLADFGRELIGLHLMRSHSLSKFITKLIRSKDFQVEKVSYSDETVWIDKEKIIYKYTSISSILRHRNPI